MNFDGDKLYKLLPALYRLRDAQLAQAQNLNQGPLQALIAIMAEQFAAMEEDLEQLYDDQFIETCAPWVIPYIGDLIGYQSINGNAPGVSDPRAEVAHTISFRRRKGTVLVIEQLARDVTGWGAHAVEFFQVLASTQYMNHIRRQNHYAPDLRRWQPRDYMNTGFDATAHKVNVRRIAIERGCYNIQNIGIFLWSLNAYSVTGSPLAVSTASPLCLRFSPLGADLALFNRPLSQGASIGAAALPINVADRLTRRVLRRDMQSGAGAAYYGAGNSVVLYFDNAVVNPYQIKICDLSGDEGHWRQTPAADGPYAAAIDPQLGRIALRPATATYPLPKSVTATFHYGFNGDMGGGEYPRSDSFTGAGQNVVRVPNDYPTIQAALDSLNGDGVVEVTGSGTYAVDLGLTVNVKESGHIELRAADQSRPTLVMGSAISVSGGPNSSFDLNGFCLTYGAGSGAGTFPVALVYAPGVPTNALEHLGVTHCTLVPGWALDARGGPRYGNQPALAAEPSGLDVVVSKSILGAICATKLVTVTLSDTILDATGRTEVAYSALGSGGAGGALTMNGCTVVGKVHATVLTLISNSIIWAALSEADLSGSAPGTTPSAFLADREQEGCIRFSYLPASAKIPRFYDCVTETPALPGPLFASLRYGDPGYGKLLASTDDGIRRGADDGGEMGAFHFIFAPLRETDLRTRMQEYIPVGLEYGIFYQT